MAGVNHNCWSTVHTYDGQDLIPILAAGYDEDRRRPDGAVWDKRMLHLAVAMGSIPSDYFRYYYFGDESFREAQSHRLDPRRGVDGRAAGLLGPLRGAGRRDGAPSSIRTGPAVASTSSSWPST